VHLVGFIIRIYHDAWSPERQINVQVHGSLGQFPFNHVEILAFVPYSLIASFNFRV